jgi:phosphatidate cytidylyltransferase
MAADRPPATGARALPDDLTKRVVSAIAMALIAVVPMMLGGVVLAAFVAAAGAAMAWEYHAILRAGGPVSPIGRAVFVATPGVAALIAGAGSATLALGAVAAGGLIHWALDGAARRHWALALPGLGVIAGACVAFLWLRALEPMGLALALWLVAVVVATDVGAYAVGRSVGGPKLWPRVSPNKTWSGLAGGALAAALTGAAFSTAMDDTRVAWVCLMSAMAALVAQGGDLAESAVKRHHDVKDAGTLIPGHGGLMDRFDGMVAATLAVALATALRGGPVVFS